MFRRLFLLVLLAGLGTLASTSTSAAYPMTVSPAGASRLSSARLQFIHNGVYTLNCTAALDVSLLPSAPAQGARIGEVTDARFACDSFDLTASGLPWEIQASSLATSTATLQVRGVGLTVWSFGSPWCLYAGVYAVTIVKGANASMVLQPNTLTASCGGTGTFRAGTTFAWQPVPTITW